MEKIHFSIHLEGEKISSSQTFSRNISFLDENAALHFAIQRIALLYPEGDYEIFVFRGAENTAKILISNTAQDLLALEG